MASFMQPRLETFKAETNMSGNQYKFVKHGTGDREIDLAGANGGFGILINAPTEIGDFAEVAMEGGGALLKLAAAVSKGNSLNSDASGEGVVAAATETALAVAVEDGVIGDVIEVERVRFVV